MFKRILIANRGESAVRIIRCCHENNIEAVAVYSTADADSLHVQMADAAVCIGPPKPSESYLNMANIFSATIATGCEAIHPGFGFLSENSEFSRLCDELGIVFIGPSADIISAAGNKNEARRIMRNFGVPVVPGSDGNISDVAHGMSVADQIGYPVLVKAAAGGGGRGMRTVHDKKDFAALYEQARSEAKNAFGDDEMYIEKFIVEPKHIEFQILGDKLGHIVHLGERECSVQRRNQKMIEESPSKALGDELREKMSRAALGAARALGYYGAGTVEFVLDKTGNFYFIEMNTRIQVEHPVTEMVTGIDIVKEQLRIAAGLPLAFAQEDIVFSGHAIECRINAEVPSQNFRPSPGVAEFLHIPGGMGVRVDSALYQGYETGPHYDSMIAKIIAHAPTRLEALRRLRRAVEEFVLEGFETNIGLAHLILYHSDFIKGSYNTSFIEKNLDSLLALECSKAVTQENP